VIGGGAVDYPPASLTFVTRRIVACRLSASSCYDRIVRKLILASLCALPLAAGEFKGWISDSSCGVGNAGGAADSRECAERCIRGGAHAVLVTDGEQKVFKLTGKVDALKHIKYKVKVTGEQKGDSIEVAKVEKAD